MEPTRPLTNTIDTMLLEERRYAPDPDFARQANAQPEIYERDWEELWETEGRNRVTWFEPFSKLYEWEPPYAKWYLGGKLNVCFNCVDRHVEAGNGDKVAYFWEGEPKDERRTITFADLQGEVVRFANGLKNLRQRRRADQSGGVDLVSRAHRRRPRSDRGHLVADRDRDDPDHTAAGGDDDQAGVCDEAVSRRRGGCVQRERRRGRARRRRLSRAEAALARDVARIYKTSSGSATRTGRSTRTSTLQATAPGSTRTGISGSWAAWTTS
ncbi:MAG TPA: acetyl-coenzyme A synthetase N-terminal domain-containing protein [Gaiellaceae bacterium]|nr:acetyl-coenzyme A synthetase N-terminal domain-containing protein [Gaiellaceae bacterium]